MPILGSIENVSEVLFVNFRDIKFAIKLLICFALSYLPCKIDWFEISDFSVLICFGLTSYLRLMFMILFLKIDVGLSQMTQLLPIKIFSSAIFLILTFWQTSPRFSSTHSISGLLLKLFLTILVSSCRMISLLGLMMTLNCSPFFLSAAIYRGIKFI